MLLTDDVVTLRAFRPDDAPAVTSACSDPETQRFAAHLPSPYTLAHARAWIASHPSLDPAKIRLHAIADPATDEVLGAVEVRLGSIGSIGYWVCPSARGRGVATRAVVLLSRWALVEGGVERLELTTHPENVASQRVADRAGFVREGVLRDWMETLRGRRDSVMFSLLARDLDKSL